ncbi:MAG: type I-C CRISPR-associated protein Cas8c/Csd1 [Anaerolineaceae bacterium]|nr:type I-C CRISPR-associated protein Cas8c/Csd1 [Anaerolineaceae bacterium]
MTWMTSLAKTYDALLQKSFNADSSELLLLPISHTTQNAQIELMLNADGTFFSARVLTEKSDQVTLIPCTETSAGRTSGAASQPHPLHDKLLYLAGDYQKHTGEDNGISHETYMDFLKKWLDSPFSHPVLESIHKYLLRNTLISDLINAKILLTDEHRHLLKNWPESEKSDKPDIFKVITDEQGKAFLRFAILDRERIIRPWESLDIIQSFVSFYETVNDRNTDLDYATGVKTKIGTNHPSKIRNTGDKAKLISANDNTDFTFRGRFSDPDEASQTGYEISQKAHNALKYLIQNQGFQKGGRTFICWGSQGEKILDPYANTVQLAEKTLENPALWFDNDVDLQEGYARSLKKIVESTKSFVASDSSVILMILDAATTGRMSIAHYSEIPVGAKNQFFAAVESWHLRAAWKNVYWDSTKKQNIDYIGAPSLFDIILLAYGVDRNQAGWQMLDNDKLFAQALQRLYPCVVEERPIPLDIVNKVVQNVLNPLAFQDSNWNRQLKIACSVYKAYRKERFNEEYSMDLMKGSQDLAYNLGRWLAVLDDIERLSFWLKKQDPRTTTVMRYFAKFADYPNQTMKIIQKQMVPYRITVGNAGKNQMEAESEICAGISPEEFENSRSLDGKFLLGFEAQRFALRNASKNKKDNAEPDQENTIN